MKAPTADYSPIRQALRANTSANKAKISAQDSANWKSRFELQEKSFDLQGKSLELSQQANNDQREQNRWKYGLSLVSQVVDISQQLYKIKQSQESQMTPQVATQAQQKVDEIDNDFASQNRPKKIWNDDTDSEDWDPEYVQRVREAVYGSYDDAGFKTLSKDYLAMVKENTFRGIMNSNESQWLSTQQSNANALFSQNYSTWMNEAVQNNDMPMTTFSVYDGSGTPRELYIPTSIKSSIDAMNWDDSTKDRMYIQADQDYRTNRGAYLTQAAAQNLSSGSFMADTSSLTSLISQMQEHESGLKTPQEKYEFSQSAKNAVSYGLTQFTNSQLQQIADAGNDFNAVNKFLGEFSQGGQLYGLFFDEEGNMNPYVTEGTYNTIKSSVKGVYEDLTDKYGKLDTATIQAGINNLFSNPYITPNQISIGIDEIMTNSRYGKDWRTNTEATGVFLEAVKDHMPKDQDWTKDEGFMRSLQSAWDTVFSSKGFILNEANDAQYNAAIAVQDEMSKRIMEAVIMNPGMLKDPVKLKKTMDDIASEFDAKFYDAITTNLNEDNAPEKSRQFLLDNVGKRTFISDMKVSENGMISSDSLFVTGMFDQFNTALQNIGVSINLLPGIDIDEKSGTVAVALGEDGKTYTPTYAYFSKKSNPSEFIKYNLQTGAVENDSIYGEGATEGSSSNNNYTTDKPTNEGYDASYSKEERANEILSSYGMTPMEMLNQCPNSEVLNIVYNTLYKKAAMPSTKSALEREYNRLIEHHLDVEATPAPKAPDVEGNVKDAVDSFTPQTLADPNAAIDISNLGNDAKEQFIKSLNEKTWKLWRADKILNDMSAEEVQTFIDNRTEQYRAQIEPEQKVASSLGTKEITAELGDKHSNLIGRMISDYRKDPSLLEADVAEIMGGTKFSDREKELFQELSSRIVAEEGAKETSADAIRFEGKPRRNQNTPATASPDEEQKMPEEVSSALESLGKYFGKIDGVMGFKSIDRLESWYTAIKNSTTYPHVPVSQQKQLETIYSYMKKQLEK